MKLVLNLVGVPAAIIALSLPAAAQNYPWCVIYGAFGARNCGFVSYEQCMATAWGNGGTCRPNTLYVPPPGPHPHSSKRYPNS